MYSHNFTLSPGGSTSPVVADLPGDGTHVAADDEWIWAGEGVRGGQDDGYGPRGCQNLLGPGLAAELHGRQGVDDSVVPANTHTRRQDIESRDWSLLAKMWVGLQIKVSSNITKTGQAYNFNLCPRTVTCEHNGLPCLRPQTAAIWIKIQQMHKAKTFLLP